MTDYLKILAQQEAPISAGGRRDLMKECGLTALPPGSTLEAAAQCLERLAIALNSATALERELARRTAIEQLHRIGVGAPAGIVNAALPRKISKADQEAGSGSAIAFPPIEPWMEPVTGEELLAELEATFSRFLALKDGTSAALALWTVLTHAHDAFDISPILGVTSPEKQCGKTTLLDLLGALVPRPVAASNITTASLFRTIEAFSPTVLLDEADTYLPGREELRGILNSGHRRSSAFVVRLVGDQHTPQQFRTWCPKAIGCIGSLPDTLDDRAIVIRMRRRRRDERVEPMRQDRLPELEPLRRRAARWALDNLAYLRAADPAVPEGFRDRAADNWRPLLAIAQAAGRTWYERALRSAEALVSSAVVDEAPTEQLLSDIRQIFAGRDRLTSEDLVTSLVALEDRPWSEWREDRPITQRQLARLLARYEIRPKVIRLADRTPRGYEASDFADAFARYLGPDPQHPQQTIREGIRSEPGDPVKPEPPPSSPEWLNVADVAHGLGVLPDDATLEVELALEREAIEHENDPC